VAQENDKWSEQEIGTDCYLVLAGPQTEQTRVGFYPINDTAVSDEERVRFQVKPRARLMAEPDQSARWPPEAQK